MSDTRRNGNGVSTFFHSMRFRDWMVLIMALVSIFTFAKTRASVERVHLLETRVSVVEELVKNDIADIKSMISANRDDMKELRRKVSSPLK